MRPSRAVALSFPQVAGVLGAQDVVAGGPVVAVHGLVAQAVGGVAAFDHVSLPASKAENPPRLLRT
jgi:Mg-chelatase subunit ChlI